MKYYIFIQDNQINGAGQAEVLNDNISTIEVTEEMYNKYIEDTDYYVWDGEKIIENPNYEELKYKQREAEFNAKFFQTSLGYVRREATMKDGITTRNFLTDLVPLMKPSDNVPIIAYDKPDFSKPFSEADLIKTQHYIIATEQFLTECKTQAIIDFYGFNPIQPVEPVEPTEPTEPEQPEEKTEETEKETKETEEEITEEQ